MSHIVIDGNMAADPETGVADTGQSWARFRVITNDRYTNRDGTWIDGLAVNYDVAAFRRLAGNAADSLRRGDRVVVAGTLTVKSYRDGDGNERASRDIIADHIGASLALATVTITKNGAAAVAASPDAGANGTDIPRTIR